MEKEDMIKKIKNMTEEEIQALNNITNFNSTIEDLEKGYKVFGVNIRNKDMTYKLLYHVLQEMSEAFIYK